MFTPEGIYMFEFKFYEYVCNINRLKIRFSQATSSLKAFYSNSLRQ
jgi:hypothetical protein